MTLQLQRIRDLMAFDNIAAAERLLGELPQRVIEAHTTELGTIQIRIAARRGTLPDLLTRFERDPEHSATVEILKAAAAELRDAKDDPNANRVLEFLYTRELANRNFTSPNFLGLAEVRLAANDLPAALELLRRMNLMTGAPFELLNDSGSLLWRTGHPREASLYYDQLVKVQPWDPSNRLTAALVRLETGDRTAVNTLAGVAKDPGAKYATRVEAAQAIRKAGGMDALNSGTPELDLIAGTATISEAQASQPFYIPARLLAAAQTSDAASRFRLLSAAVSIAPAASGRPRLQLFRAAAESKRWFLANSLIDEDMTPEVLPSLVQVKIQIGDPNAALQYQIQLAARLTGEPKASLERTIAAAQADAERRAQNEARRPIIGDSVVPDRVVRPRLAAEPIAMNLKGLRASSRISRATATQGAAQ